MNTGRYGTYNNSCTQHDDDDDDVQETGPNISNTMLQSNRRREILSTPRVSEKFVELDDTYPSLYYYPDDYRTSSSFLLFGVKKRRYISGGWAESCGSFKRNSILLLLYIFGCAAAKTQSLHRERSYSFCMGNCQ